MRILVFGDSISRGFFGSKGGWVQRLATDLHIRTIDAMRHNRDFYAEVYNLGVSSDTAKGVIDRISSETEARRLHKEDELVVIAIGINDSILVGNKAQQDVYEFQENLEELVGKAEKLTKNIIFVGLSAVDEELTDPWEFSTTGKQYKNNRINLFEDTVKQVTIGKEVDFIPVHDKFLRDLENGHKLLSDGLHPNDAGHELIYQLVKPKIEEFLK